MAIEYSTVADVAVNGVKFLTYGLPGLGKTVLVATMPGGDFQTLIVTSEKGNLSLSPQNQMRIFGRVKKIPVASITTPQDIEEVLAMLRTTQAASILNVAVDSLTDIAERILAYELETNKDSRKAYGNMQQFMFKMIRDFLDLPGKNVYFTAHQDREKDAAGLMSYGPSMPTAKGTLKIAHFFDEVFSLQISAPDAEGKTWRMLRTRPDYQFTAKDRSGALAEFEPPDLSVIINKIKNQ